MGSLELRSKLVPLIRDKTQSVSPPGSGTVTTPSQRGAPTPPRQAQDPWGGGWAGLCCLQQGGLAWIAASDYS